MCIYVLLVDTRHLCLINLIGRNANALILVQATLYLYKQHHIYWQCGIQLHLDQLISYNKDAEFFQGLKCIHRLVQCEIM